MGFLDDLLSGTFTNDPGKLNLGDILGDLFGGGKNTAGGGTISNIFNDPAALNVGDIASGAVDTGGNFLEGLNDDIQQLLGFRPIGTNPRDPVGELSNTFFGEGGSGGFRDRLISQIQSFMDEGGDAGGVDLQLLLQQATSGDENLLPGIADQFSQISGINLQNQNIDTAVGGVQDLRDLFSSFFSGEGEGLLPALGNRITEGLTGDVITDEILGQQNQAFKSITGSGLQNALKATRQSFDPNLATSLLAGEELGARQTAESVKAGGLAALLENQATINNQSQLDFAGVGTKAGGTFGLLQSDAEKTIAGLETGRPIAGSQFGESQGTAAGLVDADIMNERLQEAIAKGDIQTIISLLMGIGDRATSTATTGIGLLFPGAFGGGGGGGQPEGPSFAENSANSGVLPAGLKELFKGL